MAQDKDKKELTKEEIERIKQQNQLKKDVLLNGKIVRK